METTASRRDGLIRIIGRIASVGLLAATTVAVQAGAQQQVAPAPPQQPETSSTQSPAAPAPSAAPALPKIDPKNFTATTPSKEEVNAFLQASWGYDENRTWEVAAI